MNNLWKPGDYNIGEYKFHGTVTNQEAAFKFKTQVSQPHSRRKPINIMHSNRGGAMLSYITHGQPRQTVTDSDCTFCGERTPERSSSTA